MNDHVNAFGLTLLVVPVLSLFALIGVIFDLHRLDSFASIVYLFLSCIYVGGAVYLITYKSNKLCICIKKDRH